MYMTFRNMKIGTGQMQDAIALATFARDRLNAEHGGHYGVSINVGGDPTAISLASGWESLADYDRARASIAADSQIQSVTRIAANFTTSVQDTIAQVLKAPGARGSYATVNTAMMHMPSVVDSIAFALEVATFIDGKIGRSMGVLTSVTGNRAGLAWIGYTDSLDQFAKDSQALETDPDYLAFFKRSGDLFVPGTLEQGIWQLLP